MDTQARSDERNETNMFGDLYDMQKREAHDIKKYNQDVSEEQYVKNEIDDQDDKHAEVVLREFKGVINEIDKHVTNVHLLRTMQELDISNILVQLNEHQLKMEKLHKQNEVIKSYLKEELNGIEQILSHTHPINTQNRKLIELLEHCKELGLLIVFITSIIFVYVWIKN